MVDAAGSCTHFFPIQNHLPHRALGEWRERGGGKEGGVDPTSKALPSPSAGTLRAGVGPVLAEAGEVDGLRDGSSPSSQCS